YYAVVLHIGTPPRPFSLIVDTGSSVTAIVCAGCDRCGRHANARFDPESSHTFARVPCSEAPQCTSCQKHTCSYSVSYQEGSSYSGFLGRDLL
ncbi:hypothetical protein EMIHUDRAFT_47679, partial [Emiliania huxleyi CCMP1516]|uniref:Peptidase A1 domain-containing protein n=3 Tax=Emiliania huxleyi TaxID=2903 RepID=A0A0D3L0Y0_EMIH1